MKSPAHFHPVDALGLSRLAIEATLGLTDLVEALHHNIATGRPPLGRKAPGRTKGVTGLVYGAVRGVTSLVGSGIDAALPLLLAPLSAGPPSPERETVLAALNGVLGDHLAVSGNPLAIGMHLRYAAMPLAVDRVALSRAIPVATPRILVLVHGLCMNGRRWLRRGHDHGAYLSREAGFTPVYLHYNSGCHISSNGREFAALLEELVRQWPVPAEELVILGHSMGGLVARSACHYGSAADHSWLGKLRALVFLGTPHFGAPLERGGHWLDLLLDASPYTAPFARLGRIRSAGITDLRHGALRDEDWVAKERSPRQAARRDGLPLPSGVRCYALAATKGRGSGGVGEGFIGDGLVPLASALGRHRDKRRDLGIPASHQWVGARMGHLDLLSSKAAGDRILHWLDAPG